jgi:hypothetical protein
MASTFEKQYDKAIAAGIGPIQRKAKSGSLIT